ncbi:MAG TPA: aminotransferase class IV [Methylomirabilota bacterium]|nr:aminotransferase class IV [Methylomirabilota bacterium]
MRTVYLNGRFVPEAEAVVSVFDRGFLYGDGVFETLRVHAGRPFQWREHWARFARGAALLGIGMPVSETELRGTVDRLIEVNAASDAVLRIQLSRGVGRRGYSPRGAEKPVLVASMHERPEAPKDGWRLVTVSWRVDAGDPLNQIKSGNRLLQVMARREAEGQGADEALLLNRRGEVVSASGANVFWIEGGTVFTPELGTGALEGTTRGLVFRLLGRLSIPVREVSQTDGIPGGAQSVFLSLSSFGIVRVRQVDDVKFSTEGTIPGRLMEAYDEELIHQTRAAG